jgi:hypothetical protein
MLPILGRVTSSRIVNVGGRVFAALRKVAAVDKMAMLTLASGRCLTMRGFRMTFRAQMPR